MRIAFFLLSLLFVQPVWARTCANDYGADCGDAEETAGTCETLGYSLADVEDCPRYLYCPFNPSYKRCVNQPAVTSSEPRCLIPDLKLNCAVGDVFYSDWSCGKVRDYSAGGTKEPIGVVYYVTDGGAHGKVINLYNIYKGSDYLFHADNPYGGGTPYLKWGWVNYDISGMTYYNSCARIGTGLKNHEEQVYNGSRNTDIILSNANPSCGYPLGDPDYQDCIPHAARASKEFYPTASTAEDPCVGAGKWYLPALGEYVEMFGYTDMDSILTAPNRGIDYGNTGGSDPLFRGIPCDTGGVDASKGMDIVAETLLALKNKGVQANTFTNDIYWTSTIGNTRSVWVFNPTVGGRYVNPKSNANYLRFGLEF